MKEDGCGTTLTSLAAFGKEELRRDLHTVGGPEVNGLGLDEPVDGESVRKPICNQWSWLLVAHPHHRMRGSAGVRAQVGDGPTVSRDDR
jgi:hypothetical protein